MRIEEKMVSGCLSRNQEDAEEAPMARPESPITIDDPQGVLTDIEDMDEQGSFGSQHQAPFSNTLHVPGGNPGAVTGSTVPDVTSDEVHTDTEVVTTENEEEEEEVENTPLSEEQVARLVESYQNEAEGEISVQGNMGEKMIVSQVTRSTPGLNPPAHDEEVLTDVEEVEGDDEDIQIDIIDVGTGPIGPFIFEFPVDDEGSEVITVSMKEKDVETVPEEDEHEDALTDVEDLEHPEDTLRVDGGALLTVPSRKGSRSSRGTTPEFVVDPATDEESIDGAAAGTSRKVSFEGVSGYLRQPHRRSVTPSDAGDDRLYEDITDEEDVCGAAEAGGRISMTLGIDDVDAGELTDYEDVQDSGEDEIPDPDQIRRSVALEQASADAAERIFQETSSAASTEVVYKEQSFDKDLDEELTDDDEIHCESVDSRRMPPRLVLYQAKNTLLIESDDEHVSEAAALTDVEEMTVAEYETPTGGNPTATVYTMEEEKIIDQIMESLQGNAHVQESEKEIDYSLRKDSLGLMDQDEGALTDIENLDDFQPVPSIASSAKSREPRCVLNKKLGSCQYSKSDNNDADCDQVKIVISPGSPDISGTTGAGSGGVGGIARRRAKKKHRKNRERDSIQAQLEAEASEYQSEGRLPEIEGGQDRVKVGGEHEEEEEKHKENIPLVKETVTTTTVVTSSPDQPEKRIETIIKTTTSSSESPEKLVETTTTTVVTSSVGTPEKILEITEVVLSSEGPSKVADEPQAAALQSQVNAAKVADSTYAPSAALVETTVASSEPTEKIAELTEILEAIVAPSAAAEKPVEPTKLSSIPVEKTPEEIIKPLSSPQKPTEATAVSAASPVSSSPSSPPPLRSPVGSPSFEQQIISQSNKSPTLYDPNELDGEGKASPIHAEIKLLVRTSENGRESVEIRSLREVVGAKNTTSEYESNEITKATIPSLNLPSESSPSTSPELSSPSGSMERTESPILTQRLLVRIHEDSIPQATETSAVTGERDENNDVVIQEIQFSRSRPQNDDDEPAPEYFAHSLDTARVPTDDIIATTTSHSESVKSPVRERLIPIEKEGGGILRNNGEGAVGVEITEITDDDENIQGTVDEEESSDDEIDERFVVQEKMVSFVGAGPPKDSLKAGEMQRAESIQKLADVLFENPKEIPKFQRDEVDEGRVPVVEELIVKTVAQPKRDDIPVRDEDEEDEKVQDSAPPPESPPQESTNDIGTHAVHQAAHSAVTDVIAEALSTLEAQGPSPSSASPKSPKQHVRFEGVDDEEEEETSEEEKYSRSSSSQSSVENVQAAGEKQVPKSSSNSSMKRDEGVDTVDTKKVTSDSKAAAGPKDGKKQESDDEESD